MKKILFIDRDGTIIIEPSKDFQIDSLEKLEFLPGAISNLKKIREELDYLFVMVTNQDGLGTDSFPEESFWPAQNKMLKTLSALNFPGCVYINSSRKDDQGHCIVSFC